MTLSFNINVDWSMESVTDCMYCRIKNTVGLIGYTYMYYA